MILSLKMTFYDGTNCIGGNKILLEDSGAVSYTHLDVYKRQPWKISERNMSQDLKIIY